MGFESVFIRLQIRFEGSWVCVTYSVWQHCWSLYEIETFSVYLSGFLPLHTRPESLTAKWCKGKKNTTEMMSDKQILQYLLVLLCFWKSYEDWSTRKKWKQRESVICPPCMDALKPGKLMEFKNSCDICFLVYQNKQNLATPSQCQFQKCM